jgi:hypothetical protein
MEKFCEGLPLDGLPDTFGLRAFPGRIFRVGSGSYKGSGGKWIYYLEVTMPNGAWVAFCKGTRSELFAELLRF